MSKTDYNEKVEVDAEVTLETEKAYKIKTPDGKTLFIPKSRSFYDEATHELSVERWLAEKEGLV